ncbi:Cytosolic carboxypeptidase 2 [Bulinus truncatus]|nr:Cytosolic carboxypeptidase 2 [Bulinus truncatus]
MDLNELFSGTIDRDNEDDNLNNDCSSEEWSSESIDLSDYIIGDSFQTDKCRKSSSCTKSTVLTDNHSKINTHVMPLQEMAEDANSGNSFINDDLGKNSLDCIELRNSPDKLDLNANKCKERAGENLLEKSISVDSANCNSERDSFNLSCQEKSSSSVTNSVKNSSLDDTSESDSDLSFDDSNSSITSCSRLESVISNNGLFSESYQGICTLSKTESLKNNSGSSLHSTSIADKRRSTIDTVSNLSVSIMSDSRCSSRVTSDSKGGASSSSECLTTGSSKGSRQHNFVETYSNHKSSRNSRTLDVESISSSKCKFSERIDRKHISKNDVITTPSYSSTSNSSGSLEISENQISTPQSSTPLSSLKSSRISCRSSNLGSRASSPFPSTRSSAERSTRQNSNQSTLSNDSNLVSNYSSDASTKLTISQESGSTVGTSLESYDSDTDSTTLYTSSSSDSSWLDYEYAAYILKPRYEKKPEWVQSILEKFSTLGQASDTVKEDLDMYSSADNKLQEDLLKTTQLIYSCGESGKMVPRLREPRSLYALNKELGPQQAARWPSDLQVINERIRHIQTIPPEPEPFYKQTGFEKSPMVRGEANGGKVVFAYDTQASFFMKSRAGGSRSGCDQSSVMLESESDTTLIFESRFESGNLGKAVKVGERDYELWLRYDLYTNKHTQWFYFRVSNTRADVEYRFTIVNFMKPDSLYNNGMKPVMYSEKEAEVNKVGWVRAGNDIKYYRNNMRYEMGKGDRYYYSMTWTARFIHDHDTVYFSHCYPYTYTDLQNYLLDLTNDPIKSRICKQRVLCRTLAGNLVYVLTITSASQNPEDMKHKKAVVVTSRVHPGESNSSWMMKGFLDFVTSNSPDAKLLRDTFIFKVVPMLNPDGVIVGNYRCSLTGRDLNRNYKTTLKDAYPSVWHTKAMIRKLLLEREIVVYCDLHGHSRRQNVFIYGCEQAHNSNKRFHERIFPSMLNRNTPEKFCFKSCKFKVQKGKEGTGRVVMWNMGIMNSYTMEATFCGSNMGKKKGFHFNQRDFEMMGYHFCDTLLDYCDPDTTKYKNILLDLEEKHHMMILSKMAEKGLQPEDIQDSSDLSTDTESSDGGSDSSISDGPPLHLQFASSKPKKKKLRSKKEREKLHKEEARKTTPVQEEKKLRSNPVKPLKQETVKPMKYTSNAPKRARSLDDRTNSGIPVFVQERFEEKQQKKHEYLEALTAAYISNNIPIVTDPGHASNREASKTSIAVIRQPSKIAMATSDIWSSDPVVHFRYSGKNSEFQNSHPLAESDQSQAADLAASQCKGEALTDSARFQSISRELELQRITPKWLQEQAARIYARRGDSPFKISRIFGRREVHKSESSVEDILNSHLVQPGAVSQNSRKPKPHLLEVSAIQQRQTESLSRNKYSPIKTHPNPFDEISESFTGATSDVPVLSTVPQISNSTPVKLIQLQSSLPQSDSASQQTAHSLKNSEKKYRDKSGRKSRKSMRDDEEDDTGSKRKNSAEYRRISSAEHRRISSAECRTQNSSNDQDVKSEVETPYSIKSAKNVTPKPTELTSLHHIKKSEIAVDGVYAAGEYIEKLIKDTHEEIKDLTNEIQLDLEKKQLHKSKDNSKIAIINLKDNHIKEFSKLSERNQTVSSHTKSGNELISHISSNISENKKFQEKNRFPSVSPSAQMVTDSNYQIKSDDSSMFSPTASLQATTETIMTAIGTKNKESQEELFRSRSLKRHASLTSLQSSNNRSLVHGKQSMNQMNISSSNLDQAVQGNIQQKPSKPFVEDFESSSLHKQLSTSTYSPIAKGVRLNKHNVVFKADGQHPETAGMTTSRSLIQHLESKEAHEGELGESIEPLRSRSARSSTRQVIETVPTKISLIICQDHHDTASMPASHLLSLSRQGKRALFSRQQVRRK